MLFALRRSARALNLWHCEGYGGVSFIRRMSTHSTGHDQWYAVYVPIADRLYDDHLEQLKKEELKNG